MTYFSKFLMYGAVAGALSLTPGFAQAPADQGQAAPTANGTGSVVNGQRNNTGNLSNSNGTGNTGATNSPYTNGGLNNSGANSGDHNFGWVGLVGLAGLAGLFRGTRRSEPDFSTRPDYNSTDETKLPR